MIRWHLSCLLWRLVGLVERRRQPPPPPAPTIIVITAPAEPTEDGRMALLRRRYADHSIAPGLERPITLAELQRLMRAVRSEHKS